MASIDGLVKQYPKFKMMGKFKQMATTYSQVQPKVSYYCLLRIAEMLNTLRQVAPNDNSVTEVLKNLIGVLKGMKQKTGASQETDQVEIEKFVGIKFKEADDELRGGNASPMTIKKLLDSANLIELLIVFGPIGSESVKRKKWAKVQAVKMNKNLKAGRDIYDGLGLNVVRNNNQPGINTTPPPQNIPQAQPKSNPFGSGGNQFQPQAPKVNQIANSHGVNNGGFSNNYGGGNTNVTKSVLNTPESGLLASLSTVKGTPLVMDLNSNFQVNITKSTISNNLAPPQSHQGGPKGSFLQSGLYRKNIANFYMQAAKIQDYLKKARNNCDKSLDKTYVDLVNCKKLMDSLLNN